MSITMARMEEILESFNSHDVDRIVRNFDENGNALKKDTYYKQVISS